jgi:N-acyl-D-amino-acid deacylase
MRKIIMLLGALFLGACTAPQCDLLIVNGQLYDGTGAPAQAGVIAINADTIAYIGPAKPFKATKTIDAQGMAVSPGFINMLSWGYSSLMEDGRSLSDLKQGVTLEVFGEGTSPGPRGSTADGDYVGFGEAMKALEQNGVSTNIASYLGAASVRIQTVGYANRKATTEEQKQMEAIVAEAMQEGAMGIGSSLIYAPGDYADTKELILLNKVAAAYQGKYISHMRNEDDKVLAALEELITISKEAGVPAEIYHLKASRKPNWHLLDSIIARVEAARKEGLPITADMYTYNASSTGLTGVIPTWVQEGGHRAWIERMKDPKVRKRLIKDIEKELNQQPPSGILMVGFNTEAMADKYRGKTIEEAAQMRKQKPAEAIIDMIIEDDSRIQCIYFSMSEENIRKKVQLPWVSFCSDAGSYSDITKDFRTHPRAFGSFIRVLGKFSRDEKLLTLEQAVHKLSGLPAANLGLTKRGTLQTGNFADIVIFNPETVDDHATFDAPLQYATGVNHVLVNGIPVLENGAHTGAFSGRFVKGPGATR